MKLNFYFYFTTSFSIISPAFASLSFISSDKPSQRTHLHSSIYVIPDEGDSVVFRCTQQQERAVKTWILPNGDRVVMNDGGEEIQQTSTLQPNDTQILDFRENIVFTKHTIEISSIKVGMDGKYTCMFEDGEMRRSFYIPYVVSHIGFSQSAMLSLSISAIFCVLCLLVLLVDCYFSHRHNQIDAAALEPMARRKGQMVAVEALDTTSLESVELEDVVPPLYSPTNRRPANLPEIVVSQA
uniref:Ig-like domain-containing protein n=1 Tax=Ditylenchus dipsaci TaxID=166011 RepID=A0A915CXF7_9BILA